MTDFHQRPTILRLPALGSEEPDQQHRREPFPTRLVSWLVALTMLTVLLASMTPQLVHLCGSQGFRGCVGTLSFSTSSGSTAVIPPPACPVMRSDPSFGISLIDPASGQVICERNGEGIAQPASTTKVMTALLTEEYLRKHHLSLDTIVTIQPADTDVEPDAAIAGLEAGQQYSVRTLLAMTSILSAADSTMTLAQLVAGSRAAFLALMNTRAAQLGMNRTHYTSPYGYAKTSVEDWQDGETVSVANYSTAHDMALLMSAFARYPDLITIFGAHDYQDGSLQLSRSSGYVLPDSWVGLPALDGPPVQNLQLPFQVVAVKKGCMWCDPGPHKLSYVLLARFQRQTIAAAFLYTTQDYNDPQVGDMLPVLLWAFHQCRQPAYANYCDG